MQGKQTLAPLRTRIYIDGYNFYYGCLKGTAHKWLDLMTLFEQHILPSVLVHDKNNQTRQSVLIEESSIKFFTAKIIESVSKSTDSVSCQARYHTALSKTHQSRIEIIEGYYAVNKIRVKVVDPKSPDKNPNECGETQAWKVEEKQSDVNLALQIYHDAICNNVDHVVVVTNDTDIQPALEMIRANTDVIIGLVVPTLDDQRPASKGLTKLAHWTRSPKEDELKNSQLPRVIPSRKPTIKPISWYAYPSLLQEIIDLATPVLKKKNNVFKWLETESADLNGQKPIVLAETEEGAQQVITYIKSYLNNN